jgi:glycosyltransferase involved in cell wall biosynthesis
MRQFAAAIAQEGHLAEVIAVGRAGAPPQESVDGVDVYRIQSRIVDERRPRDHVRKTLTFLLRAAVFVARQHLREPYDLIHVQSIPDFLVFAAAVPRLLGTPVILDLRDLVPELYACKFDAKESSLLVRLLRVVERLSATVASHVITANPIWHERVLARSVSCNKCSTFWYYPDLEVFYPREKKPSDRFIVMYPGTLHWHQGVDVAVKAFPKILRQIPQAEFHIYGDGPAKDHLVSLATELGLADKVTFHDVLPTKEIAERMGSADVGIVPKRAGSRFGNEAASTKIPEFLALGVPVVVSRTAIDERMYDDSMVRFFESESEDAAAEAVLAIWRDQAARDRLIVNGLKYSEENNWKTRIQEYLHLVDSLTTPAD